MEAVELEMDSKLLFNLIVSDLFDCVIYIAFQFTDFFD